MFNWLLGQNKKGGPDTAKKIAGMKTSQKYLYNLPTMKRLQGLQLLYREQEYFLWFQDNINYLMQFYTTYSSEPTELLPRNRINWYENTEEDRDNCILKVHVGVANFITTMMNNLVFSGPVEIKINSNDELNNRLQKAFSPEENDIQNFLRKADIMESVGGTVLFKCNYDNTISDYPILEYYEVNKIDYVEHLGRIKEMITVDTIVKGEDEYYLTAEYSRKGIEYKLFRNESEVEMSRVFDTPEDEPKGLNYFEQYQVEYGPLLAVWKQRRLMSKEFYNLKLGQSDYEGNLDIFQTLDEIYSRFVGQIRATQPFLFMSEELMGYKVDSEGKSYLNIPKKLGVKVIPLSSGLSNVDGKSIAAMFNRDVPELTGVAELQGAFEWTLRMLLVTMMVSPTSGNADTANVGSNTTSSSLFKREQSTHLVRKQMIESWTTAIKGIVKLVCRWFDVIDGKLPQDYEDLNIDVKFPDIDMDDFNTRLDQAVTGFVSGLFDIREGVKHAFGNKLTEDDQERLIKSLEQQRKEAQAQGPTNVDNRNAKSDTLAKMSKMSMQNSKKAQN